MIHDLSEIRIQESVLKEETTLLNHVKEKAYELRTLPHKIMYYYFIQDERVIFKSIGFIKESRSSYKFDRPTLCIEGIYKLKGEAKYLLPRQVPSFLEGMKFQHLHFLPKKRWMNLLNKFEIRFGTLPTYATHVDYRKYLTMSRWTLPRFIFYLILYQEWRVLNLEKEEIAKYYNLSFNEVNQVTATMFDILCKTKRCELYGYYTSKFDA